MRRIGIDVGGTNTDAVLLENGRIVHAIKTPTTPDVTGGIVTALDLLGRHPEVGRATIDGVVIGTTHFVNAVVQRRGLARVAAIRIGLPTGASLPPFCDWPADLAALVEGGSSCSKAGMIMTAARSCRLTKQACARRPGRYATRGCVRSRSPRCFRPSTRATRSGRVRSSPRNAPMRRS